jgi:ankyrin repeat protein
MGNKAAKNDMLYEASKQGDLRSVKKLIKAGADPNATGGDVCTPTPSPSHQLLQRQCSFS